MLCHDDPHDGSDPSETLRAAPLVAAVGRIESEERLDAIAEQLTPLAARVGSGRRGSMLRGDWLGHALHPLMSDLPLGCWLAASVLDVTCARDARRAAQRLVATGLLASLPTALTGIAEYGQVNSQRPRRVAVVHALGNTVVVAAYLMSWRARRRGHHTRGAALSMIGGTGAVITGYLGGHLAFARGAGTGQRGM